MRKIFTCFVASVLATGAMNTYAQRLITTRQPFTRVINTTQTPTSNSQTKADKSLWTYVAPEDEESKNLVRNPPTQYSVYRLNIAALKTHLWDVSTNPANAVVVALPMADGSFRDFKVWQAPMMPPTLASKFPDIKTYSAEAVNDARVTAKLDFTLYGFHSVVFDGNKLCFIDPHDIYTDAVYIIHDRAYDNSAFHNRMKCEVSDHNTLAPTNGASEMFPNNLPGIDLGHLRLPSTESNSTPASAGGFLPSDNYDATPAAITSNGTILRTYRIALSANNQYCTAVTAPAAPTIPTAFSAMTTSMNRVNGVYNRELSVQLNFCINEDQLIWPTATGSVNGPDPFDAINTSGPACIDQNQITCDARIGTANYDVGHVFTTGGGGLASVAGICNSGRKAKGVTGSGAPYGDNFDIDYVCHELGHQFGSSHTFNNNGDGACSGNASSTHAYEPGSGATIMDYAGICSPDNLQPHSDPYFSFNSLEQIQAHISGSGGGCAVTASTGHAVATVSGFTASYNIPYKTPFELTSPTAVTGGMDTAVTYGWCQQNLGDFGLRLAATHVHGPIFRSYQPVYGETRVFPSLPTILAGGLTNSGEKAPDTTRYLTFKPVIRNIFAGNGCFTIPDDTIHINAYSTGSGNGYEGFVVTSQSSATTYFGGSTQTVTWNVVGTNAAPVSATNVDIFMSVDGGLTWPFTVGTFPNTGSASVTIPDPGTTSTTCRIKVKGSGNVFFNINGANFTVNPGVTTAPITGTLTVCTGATTALSDATTGGTWSSSTPAVGTISASGVVTGITTGTTTISYTAPSGTATAVVTVNTTPTPAAITGSSAVCVGFTSTLSDATPGGTWSSSSASVATVSTSGVVSGVSAGTANITYTVTNACGSGIATKAMTVSAATAVAGITGTLTVCNGATTTLSNATPSGTWSSSNTAVATVSASGVVSGVSAGTTTISYNVTNPSGCISSASSVVTVNATPTATTTPTGPVVICTSASITINASPTTAGLTYQWQDGGTDIPGATSSSYTTSVAGSYRVVITNTSGCSGTSPLVAVTVSGSAVVVPDVTVSASPGTTVCSTIGTVSYTAIPVNGGPSPSYEWFVNGTPVGGPGVTFSYTPANGDIVKCNLTSSLACAVPATVSDSVTMTVNPAVTPDVLITPSPNDTVCIGQSVTYIATPINGGSSPTYQWTENGINVATGLSYTTIPTNGDIIFCAMTGAAACATATGATSAPLVMTVQSPVANTVSISASSPSISAGESVTFVAVALNAGSSATYEWFIDGSPVPGATNVTYTTSDITNGQVVHCKVTSSLPCVTPRIALSPGFTMMVTTGLWEVTKNGNSFTVNPNPNSGSFSISGKLASVLQSDVHVSVINVIGQTVYDGSAIVKNGLLREQISLPPGTPTGTYLLTVTSDGEQAIFRMVVEN